MREPTSPVQRDARPSSPGRAGGPLRAAARPLAPGVVETATERGPVGRRATVADR